MNRRLPAALSVALLTVATLITPAITATAQVATVTTVSGAGITFIAPKGFTDSGKLVKAIKESATSHIAADSKVPFVYCLLRPLCPTAIMVMTKPCPEGPLPDEVVPMIRNGFLSTDPTLKVLSEGWAQIGGERSYVLTASAMFDTKQPGAAPLLITRCFTAVPHHGVLTTFLFTARADTFAKDSTAYAEMLNSVRFK